MRARAVLIEVRLKRVTPTRRASLADLPLSGGVDGACGSFSDPIDMASRLGSSVIPGTGRACMSHPDQINLLCRLLLAFDLQERKRAHRLAIAARVQGAERLAHLTILEGAVH